MTHHRSCNLINNRGPCSCGLSLDSKEFWVEANPKLEPKPQKNLIITDAVEAGCIAFAVMDGIEWASLPEENQGHLRDRVAAVIEGAMPFLVDFVEKAAAENLEQNGTVLVAEPMFVCFLCLARAKPESPDNDDRLTVISGMMVCGDHEEYAGYSNAKARRIWLEDAIDRIPRYRPNVPHHP